MPPVNSKAPEGAAQVGVIVSFGAGTGVLSVSGPNGKTFTFTVNGKTELRWHGTGPNCVSAPTTANLTAGRRVFEIRAAEGTASGPVAVKVDLAC